MPFSPKTPSILVTIQRDNTTRYLIPEIIGFTVYTIIFVPSLIISVLCLYYLFKDKRKNSLHVAVIVFSIAISSFNMATFALKSVSIISHLRFSTCPSIHGVLPEAFSIFSVPTGSHLKLGDLHNIILSNALIPTFLWVSDAFLIYRAWVVWIGHRWYTILPGMVLLASIATGIIWLVQTDGDSVHWVPALGFSVGLDSITTGMIAGRLIYRHTMQKKSLGGSHTSPYLLLMAIFIESAALSLISKIIQISIPSVAITQNPLVIPLCTISSNLIILRKALGLDVLSNRMKGTPHLPMIQFNSQHPRPPLGTSWGGLEKLVVQSVGGNVEVKENLDTSSTNLGSHSEQS